MRKIAYLREHTPEVWLPCVEPAQIGISVVVFDRFHRQTLVDVHGGSVELPETHLPV